MKQSDIIFAYIGAQQYMKLNDQWKLEINRKEDQFVLHNSQIDKGVVGAETEFTDIRAVYGFFQGLIYNGYHSDAVKEKS